jgi:methanogenic corrinoid protein MtbC1
VDGEIIPRLLLAHRSLGAEKPSNQGRISVLSPESVDRFAQLALISGRDSLLAVVGNLLQQGVRLDDVYMELLAPAARRLGELWDDDVVPFSDVTIALGRMHQVVRELSIHHTPAAGAHVDRAALFAPAPGEQHTFGLVIIEEFFRRSGWRTWTELSSEPEEVIAAAKTHAFDVFGLTASAEQRLDPIAFLIMSVRRASRNRDVIVIVGGRLFSEHPELVARVGADGMAASAPEAVLKAEGAVRQLARR